MPLIHLYLLGKVSESGTILCFLKYYRREMCDRSCSRANIRLQLIQTGATEKDRILGLTNLLTKRKYRLWFSILV